MFTEQKSILITKPNHLLRVNIPQNDVFNNDTNSIKKSVRNSKSIPNFLFKFTMIRSFYLFIKYKKVLDTTTRIYRSVQSQKIPYQFKKLCQGSKKKLLRTNYFGR